MSVQQSNDKSTVDDIFKGMQSDDLHDGDDLDSLDLTTPLPKKDKKEVKKEDKDEDEEEESESEEEIDEEEEDEDLEDIDELDELEEELTEPTEEQLELDAAPIRRKEILKEFPELFKKFPAVEKAIYREREFTKILPTIKDAERAVKDSETLQNFAADMIEEGNTFNLLKLIKDNNINTFYKVADNYLEHLAQVDEPAYRHVIGNVIKNTIVGMVREAKDSQDDDLRIAAGLLNKYVFGNTKFDPPKNLAKEEKTDKKENTADDREKKFVQQQLETVTNEIDNRVQGSIKGFIEKNIDPKGSMTDFVKKHAVKDAIDRIKSLIGKDSRFSKLNEKLWEKLVQSNFDQSSRDNITKAYLSRARSLMGPVLKSARNEALKGMGKRVKDETVDKDDNTDEKPKRQKTERRLSSNKDKANLDAVKGMSSLDALNTMLGEP